MDAKSTTDTGQKGSGKARLLSLDDLDRRTKVAQYALNLRDQLVQERGGERAMSAMCRALLDDVAMTSTMIRDMQVRWLRGADVSAPELCTLINTRRRLLESPEIGPPVTPSISLDDPTDIRKSARAILEILEQAAKLEAAAEATEALS